MKLALPMALQPGRQATRVASMSLAAVLVIGTSGVRAADAPEPQTAPIDTAQPTRISEQVAAALGNDPEAIFHFVADGVRYEPYVGALRGAAGTYYSRAGNSVDQALLLARLLNAAGVETRFAVGSIDDAAAANLLAAGVDAPDRLLERSQRALFGRLPNDAEAPPALPSAADYVPGYDASEQAAVASWTVDRVAATQELITSQLDARGITVDAGLTQVPVDERKQHTWVQASLNDEWVDLDASLPGLGVGERITEPVDTIDSIPDERFHRIEIGVIAEHLDGGTLVQEEILTLEGTAEELVGQPIVIANVGAESSPALSQAFQRVLGTKDVHPVIAVGSQINAGSAMSFKEPGGGPGGGFFDAGSALPEATAEWIEVRVMSPGRDPVVSRRTVFDRVGAAARAAGSVNADSLAPVESFDLSGDGQLYLAPELWVSWIDVETGLPSLRAATVNQDDGAPGALAVVPFSHHLLTELIAARHAGALGVRPFVDAPNVTALTAEVVDGSDGSPTARSVIDILERSHGVAAVAGVEAPSASVMAPGILSQVAERLMAGAAHGSDSTPAGVSVGSLFEAAAAQGVAPTVVATSDDLGALDLPADAGARLQDALGAGWVAVAPERAVQLDGETRTGWWLVDPLSGRVADQMDNGRGQDIFGKILVGLLGLVTIDLIIDVVKDQIEGSLWDYVNKRLQEDLKF